MSEELHGSVAVVTGGGKGIGRAIALALARNGADVIVVGRDQATLDEAAAEIQAIGRRGVAVAADVTNASEVARIAEAVEREFGGRADIIVTAAGTRDHMGQTLAEMDLAHLDKVMQGNLYGSLLPIRAVLPFMKARQRGKVVAISGVFGLRGRATHGASCTSKWALEGMVRTMALELGPSNINVNAVCPGYVEGPRSSTGIARAAQAGGADPQAAKAALINATALKRLSTMDDVANAVLFLVSERSRNITGQDLVVDAGWIL
jgi:3-oxoacyl-[acyl-carrier protein] reductase